MSVRTEYDKVAVRLSKSRTGASSEHDRRYKHPTRGSSRRRFCWYNTNVSVRCEATDINQTTTREVVNVRCFQRSCWPRRPITPFACRVSEVVKHGRL